MEEIWKDIEEYEGLYQISNLERVRSLNHFRENIQGGYKNARAIKIMQCTIEGKTIKIWESLMEASRKTGIKEGAISNCINKKGKTAGGYKWKYKEDKDE